MDLGQLREQAPGTTSKAPTQAVSKSPQQPKQCNQLQAALAAATSKSSSPAPVALKPGKHWAKDLPNKQEQERAAARRNERAPPAPIAPGPYKRPCTEWALKIALHTIRLHIHMHAQPTKKSGV